ncbi:MAG: HAD family phosphatase [Chloroflexi bacterium]|nr:HAD family phosphatase [Chloroflexota bacterium]
MAIRLVALDLDGTILPRGGAISDRVVAVVRAVVASGVHVTLASGRMFRLVQPYAERLTIRTPVICYGGALIREPDGGQPLYEQGIPIPLAREVVAAGRGLGHHVNVYIEDDLFVEAVSPDHPMYEALLRTGARAVGDLERILTTEPHHMALVTPGDPKSLVLRLRERFDGALNVTSGHPRMAELDHPAVSKGAGLRLVAERLGVDRSEVLAGGDDWNDQSMLEYAGLGVAMAGAPPEVQAAARVIAPPIEEDGIAQVLEEHVLRDLPRTQVNFPRPT